MSIQEIAVSNSQKKKLQQAISNEAVLMTDDNGDLVVQVAAYEDFKANLRKEPKAPIEVIVGEEALDLDAEFWVFS
ncbi:hypothetical protein SAMN02745127_02756 [Oceanospirillum multiglobuliferum]|uniref:Uncharacterized protein n=1 Tax=Oceanospirillum multiglobuliferum TaxID=64969 RepID=A0A1T4S566_9GAMM|nr:hypothetical protein [Oceanospirillum multiglobuliferum]OPX54444.1 hypothetical protein BTE48_14090 [Oceanospirillum multiglobuliferum]SKA23287.1 hypothetical protein SAMN02745127_02756 [Oceanospirillum multiglobuliferum]